MYQIIITLTKMAEKSPKPKIVYTILENLAKSSSLSKTKTQQKENSLPRHASLQLANGTSKSKEKLVSRHRLKSKENLSSKISQRSKPKEQIGSDSLQFKELAMKNKTISRKQFLEQIYKIYYELQLALHHSKQEFLNKMLDFSHDQHKISDYFKKLAEKSNEIKLLLAQAMPCGAQQQKCAKQSKLPILRPQEQNIAYLSKLNRKNINQSRLKRKTSNKKLTLYEQILKKYH